MLPSQDDIDTQLKLLRINRQTLAHYLVQRDTLGSVNTPPEISHGIRESRENIQRIKAILYNWGVTVLALPTDEEPSVPSYQVSLCKDSNSQTPRHLSWQSMLGGIIVAIIGGIILTFIIQGVPFDPKHPTLMENGNEVTSIPTPPTSIAPLTSITGDDKFSDYTIVQPSCNCSVYISPREKVLIRLRWGGRTAELAERGADFLRQTVSINSDVVPNIEKYRKTAVFVENPMQNGDPENAWWVYWDIPVGQIRFDTIKSINVQIETSSAIDTGWSIIPSGVKKVLHVEVDTAMVPYVNTRPIACYCPLIIIVLLGVFFVLFRWWAWVRLTPPPPDDMP